MFYSVENIKNDISKMGAIILGDSYDCHLILSEGLYLL
tara:strand:- start:243 stop:356 length:114 start_codon:yes stop_codon:yes gene_type:complete